MIGVTVSTKRNRVYPHRFDHDLARRMRAEGATLKAIAEVMGVTPAAVKHACDEEERRRSIARRLEWMQQAACPECGAQTTRTTVGGDSRCRACSTKAMATSVRDGELRCVTCQEWKPDHGFPRNRAKKGTLRRGRHTSCRACQTKARQAYRERHKVPCDRCGKPRLSGVGGGRGSHDGGKTGLCKACYLDRNKR